MGDLGRSNPSRPAPSRSRGGGRGRGQAHKPPSRLAHSHPPSQHASRTRDSACSAAVFGWAATGNQIPPHVRDAGAQACQVRLVRQMRHVFHVRQHIWSYTSETSDVWAPRLKPKEGGGADPPPSLLPPSSFLPPVSSPSSSDRRELRVEWADGKTYKGGNAECWGAGCGGAVEGAGAQGAVRSVWARRAQARIRVKGLVYRKHVKTTKRIQDPRAQEAPKRPPKGFKTCTKRPPRGLPRDPNEHSRGL